jgi:ectoine hydroxylase-related dioxygenase (phytanoyl-CoA dioxygenase family)
VKDPHSGPRWWHRDRWCWNRPESLRREAPQAALLRYLDDPSATTGALRVLPGSHATSTALHAATVTWPSRSTTP